MPDTIDWPQLTPPPRSGRRKFLFLLAIVAVIVLFGRTVLGSWVDLLWFRSLGYEGVFWKARALEWGVFAGFGAATFLILYATFSLLKRAHQDDLPSDHTIYIAGKPLNSIHQAGAAGGCHRRLAGDCCHDRRRYGGAVADAGAVVVCAAGRWGVADPIFGRPLGFYLFTLPAWHLILGWLLTLSVIACVVAAVFLLVSGSSRALTGRAQFHRTALARALHHGGVPAAHRRHARVSWPL